MALSFTPLEKFHLPAFAHYNKIFDCIKFDDFLYNQGVISYRPDILKKCFDLIGNVRVVDNLRKIALNNNHVAGGGGMMAGGFLLHALGETYSYNDIDIYLTTDLNKEFDRCDSYNEKYFTFSSCVVKNDMWKLAAICEDYYLKKGYTKTIQYIYYSNTSNVFDKIMSLDLMFEIIINFDIPICRKAITLDGLFIDYHAGPTFCVCFSRDRLQKYSTRLIKVSTSPPSLQMLCFDHLKRRKIIENFISNLDIHDFFKAVHRQNIIKDVKEIKKIIDLNLIDRLIKVNNLLTFYQLIFGKDCVDTKNLTKRFCQIFCIDTIFSKY